MTPGWFILYAELKPGQISYHIPEKYLYLVQHVVRELPDYRWDGHNSEIALARLEVTAMELHQKCKASNLKG